MFGVISPPRDLLPSKKKKKIIIIYGTSFTDTREQIEILQRFDFSTEVFIWLNVLVRKSFELYISFSSMYSRWRLGAKSKTDRA